MKTLNIELDSPGKALETVGTLKLHWGARASDPQFLDSGQKNHKSLWFFLCLFLTCLTSLPATAQIQQAWAIHYNNGILNGTNQAVKMALDPAGNIYVTGFSQNTNTNLGYVTIKYAPNGNQLWATRYNSTNYPAATPSGLVLDNSNNVIVTGGAVTVKYDQNGNQLWTAPYAGASLATDTNGNIYIVGYSINFATVKLSPSGSNLWQATDSSTLGPNVSQAVAVDIQGNVDVAGSQAFYCDPAHDYCYFQMLLVQYDSNGNELWNATTIYGGEQPIQVESITLDNLANIYVLANSYFAPYVIFKYSSNGDNVWGASNPTGDTFSRAHAIALDNADNALLSGQNAYYYPNMQYGTYKINTDGVYVWTNLYPNVPTGSSVGTSITVDSANNSYVTGYSPGTNTNDDIVTIKYGPNGNRIWLKRYNGPGNGNDAGNAIAVDNNGNVYVTGYDTTTAGGTEIVTIKYSPVTLQKGSGGSFILQAQGSPGESFDIQASTDLLNWLDLGSVVADTNGLMQYTDTNASNFPSRFYYTKPQ